jgi:hypothetical protein
VCSSPQKHDFIEASDLESIITRDNRDISKPYGTMISFFTGKANPKNTQISERDKTNPENQDRATEQPHQHRWRN